MKVGSKTKNKIINSHQLGLNFVHKNHIFFGLVERCREVIGTSLQRVVVPLGASLVELPQDQGDSEGSVRQDHSADERVPVEALAVGHRSGCRRRRRSW